MTITFFHFTILILFFSVFDYLINFKKEMNNTYFIGESDDLEKDLSKKGDLYSNLLYLFKFALFRLIYILLFIYSYIYLLYKNIVILLSTDSLFTTPYIYALILFIVSVGFMNKSQKKIENKDYNGFKKAKLNEIIYLNIKYISVFIALFFN